jgi:hypothetical protein
MPKSDIQTELERLIKNGEENRRTLKELWKKVENLDAAIE